MNSALYPIWITFFSFVCLPLALAEDTTETTKSLATASPVSTSTLVETLFGLLFVLASIALVAWLLRRSTHFTSSANGQLKVLGGLSLGPRERAVLMQVGDKQILVGVTPHQVQTLHVLDDPIIETAKTDKSERFSSRLQQILQQREQS
jgi:flagellar protein FliO/FliZ